MRSQSPSLALCIPLPTWITDNIPPIPNLCQVELNQSDSGDFLLVRHYGTHQRCVSHALDCREIIEASYFDDSKTEKKKNETEEGKNNIKCAQNQMDESEQRVGGGRVREWLQFAGLQKRRVKGSKGSFLIMI